MERKKKTYLTYYKGFLMRETVLTLKRTAFFVLLSANTTDGILD